MIIDQDTLLSSLCGEPKIVPITIGTQKLFMRSLRMSEQSKIAEASKKSDGERDADLYTLGLVAASICDANGVAVIENPIAFAQRAKSIDLLWSEGNRLWSRIAELNLLSAEAICEAEKNCDAVTECSD